MLQPLVAQPMADLPGDERRDGRTNKERADARRAIADEGGEEFVDLG